MVSFQEILGSGKYVSNNIERRGFQAKRLAWIKILGYETALSRKGTYLEHKLFVRSGLK